MKYIFKTCPLLVCLLVSWGAVSAADYVPKLARELRVAPEQEAEAPLPENDVSADEMQTDGFDAFDEVQEVSLADKDDQIEEKEQEKQETAGGSASKKDEKKKNQKKNQEEVKEEIQQEIKPQYITYEKQETDSIWYSDPGKIPLTTEYPYETVADDYFDDAVFIGDSRIVGMYDYSGLTNAAFFAKTGLTIYNLLDDKFVEDPETGASVSVSDMLQTHTYGKIYLMIGINELGSGGTGRFQRTYQEALEKMREWQPEAVIYVQSILGVTPEKDASDDVYNNTNIRDKNCAIAELTDGIHIFYLNIQEIYEDENHALSQELTFDDVHLYAQHYGQWVDYLKTHAVVKGA